MRKAQARPGFTLVEILTVVAILALLAALVAAGVGKARTAQMQRNTEQTLIKLQITLDQQWKSLVDKVGLERGQGRIDKKLIDYCTTGDLKQNDRAAALYLYMLTRNEFPQNFAEAVAGVPDPSATITAPPVFGGFKLPARSVFKNVSQVDPNGRVYIGGTVDGSGNPTGGQVVRDPLADTTNVTMRELESAALLYLILAEKSLEGTKFDADDATQSAQTNLYFTKSGGGSVSFRVFADAWGTPITFTRYTQGGFNGELNNPPYTESGGNKDPLDPKNLLKSWSDTAKKKDAQAALNATVYNGGFVPQNGVSPTTQLFDGTNKQPSVYSAGANRNAGTTGTDVWSSGHADGLFGGDNLAGYRLRREGAKGD